MTEEPTKEKTGTPKTALKLLAAQASPVGRELHLKQGDILVSVNGKPFHGTENELVKKFINKTSNSLALGFFRDGKIITVLSTSSRLGVWESIPWNHEAVESRKINPNVLMNWEVLSGEGGKYDLYAMNSNIFALIAPPLWLLQMRLWLPASVMVAAGMVALAVTPVMGLVVYLAAGLHLWHMGPNYFRKDRQMRGLKADMVIAAPNEHAAHLAYLRFKPDARFIFSNAAPNTEPKIKE